VVIEEDIQEQEMLRRGLEEDLLRLYGPLLSTEVLWKVLGYQTKNAFQQAVKRNRIAIPLIEIEHRRGKFALAKDMAMYLARKRVEANESVVKGGVSCK